MTTATATRFDDRFLEEVRARTRLVDLIGGQVALKPKNGEHVGLCPFHSERTPSFWVIEKKGFAHCFGCGWSGDAISWLRDRHGMSFVEAVEDLAIRAGMQPDREGRMRPPALPVARPAPAEIEAEREDRIAWARDLWKGCQPVAGTLVEVYLRSRGIEPARLVWSDGRRGVPPTIRFHPGLRHKDSGQMFPAMVAAVQDGQRRITGVHRTFLAPDGRGKAPVASAKKMAGSVWGGAIRLCEAQSRLGVAEGIETSLSVTLGAELPVWVAGSLGNMAAIELPPIVRELVLCIDADGNPETAARTLDKAQAFHAARGIRVRLARPPAGMDFNDLLLGKQGRQAAGIAENAYRAGVA